MLLYIEIKNFENFFHETIFTFFNFNSVVLHSWIRKSMDMCGVQKTNRIFCLRVWIT